MFNKIKNSKIAKVGILSIALVILVYAVVTLGKTIGAYNIIKANYSEFNYPNTVKVHSGTFMEADDFNIFVCEISAENAYGQRIYDKYLASDISMASFDWYEEIGAEMSGSVTDDAEKSNVFIPLLNFLIWIDWC